MTVIGKWQEEQLKYDENSYEYQQLENMIVKATNVEQKLKVLANVMIDVWKEHPAQQGQLLNVSLSDDGYITMHALSAEDAEDAESDYIIDYTQLHKE